ncbi:40S ribosomal protein S8 [Cordyceps fumosorosea ARSEF 2679]|uniref:40S ribosomal protein S8 n=1 Tax=Cordyceps fumosorosea (strain ARSEF 2679) TaxID=1081104 RepID=A0A168E6M0_CORFA|nr:40S ribosomal protein S8 [Cordyceps fumosorosea ARSEF 2679]OAA73437.1 40S ribosomal protein S8 [Cordyceps fumosorosea ARSEF 2679]
MPRLSLKTLVDMCSHLQNASKARLGLTSFRSSRQAASLASALHRAGFLSSVYRAGPVPPTEEAMLTVPPEPVTTANVASRRLWLGLKYWDGRPVLGQCRAMSTPARAVTARPEELARVVRGLPTKLDAGVVKGLTLGECLFLDTSEGVLEAREALAKKVGGTLMCRVS